MNCGKKIPDTLILVIYLPPAMLFLIFLSKNSRYANFSDLSTPSYAIFDFVKKIPDMLILVLYLPLTMPLWVVSKNLDMLILVLTTWHTERLHAFLFEPKHFLLTWEVKYAIGLNR